MNNRDWVTTAANVNMPRLIYGTAWKKERTADLVVQAIQAGFKGIDTACQPKHYEEPLVGTALLRLHQMGIERDALYLQTKFTPLSGQDPSRIPYDKNAPIATQINQSIEASLKNLQTDYVDSLVLHSPLFPHHELMTAWKAMEQLQKAGNTRQLGISNCYQLEVLQALYQDATVKPAVIQNRFYSDTGYDEDLRAWCAVQGVMYQSFWTLTANPHILNSVTMQTTAKALEKTSAQILFRYLSQIGIVPLTGTCSSQHMKEDLSIFDFELSALQLKRIGALFQSG